MGMTAKNGVTHAVLYAKLLPDLTSGLCRNKCRTEPAPEQENLNLNDLGRQMLVKALERNNGNRSKAAQELGISDRTLYRRLKQYGLDNK